VEIFLEHSKFSIINGKGSLTMFVLVLIGLMVIFSYGMGNVAAANSSTIYVNGSSGQDIWDGQLAVWNGTSGPKATIKNATGTVLSDGTVYVANGTYNESNIQINNNMTIVGETQQNTIINGQKSGQSIFNINDNLNVTISNLTMTNGNSGDGGAIITNPGSSMTITNCTFTNNNASNCGGAITSSQSLALTNCTFTKNTAGNCGGAISSGQNLAFTNCTFTNNTAGNCGGAISSDGTNSTVTNCTFTYNYASNSGGAISSGGNTLTVTNCNFTNNSAWGGGGAIDNSYGSNLNVTLSNFCYNTANKGGAICNSGTDKVNFNNIIGNSVTPIDSVIPGQGTAIYDSLGTVDGTYNSWGSSTGPSTGTCIGNVTVTPWISVTAQASVNSGYYNINKIITLSMLNSGTIYYTLNGATPTTTSTIYTEPITVNSTTTLKFLAIDNSGYMSSVYTETYIIDKIPPKVLTTTPTNKKTNVSKTSTITIKFSENIKSSTYYKNIKVKNLTTGKYVTIHESISGNTLNIKTTKTRTRYNWYEIIIPKAAIKDTLETTYKQHTHSNSKPENKISFFLFFNTSIKTKFKNILRVPSPLGSSFFIYNHIFFMTFH